MGLGLYLYGDCEKPRDALLEDIAEAVRKTRETALIYSHIAVNDEGHRACALSFHPAEEDVELTMVGPTKLLVSARTSGAGPGYHAFLCELLDEVGKQFAIRWQPPDPTGETGDETGYFHTRVRPLLEAEMRNWLRAVARSLRTALAEGSTGIAISMPADGPDYEASGVVTALGPRDAAYWSAIETDDAAAERFFAWWEPGTGAGYLLGRALCRMWCDVRWREPRKPDEKRVHDEVLELLARAWALDPKRPYPFAEWQELLDLRHENLPAGAPTTDAEPAIGYRRGMLVARPFPGAAIRIPGAFSEAFDKRGNWSAWEDGRTVWVSLLSATQRQATKTAPVDQPEPTYVRFEEDGEPMHKVHGKRVLHEGDALRVLFVTVVFASSKHLDWANETYRSARLQ